MTPLEPAPKTLSCGDNNGALLLRRGAGSDVERVVEIQFAAYAKNRVLPGVEPLPLQVNYHDVFATHEVWLLEIDLNSVTAALILQARPNDLLIFSIATDPEKQSAGLGRQLLGRCRYQSETAWPQRRSALYRINASAPDRLVRSQWLCHRTGRTTQRPLRHPHGQAFKLTGLPSGPIPMPKFAANLSMMFNEVEFLDRFEAAAKAGFKGVELLFPYDYEPQEIAQRLKDNGLTQALFNLPPGSWENGERGLASLPGRESEFEAAVAKALEYAEATGCKLLHAMAGLRHHGAQWKTYISNLRNACRMASGSGVTIIIEPINQVDIPGFFLNTTATARAAIYEVGEPNIGLQFDLYHRQIHEGDVARSIREFGSLARHYQIASPPDRGEPDDGEMNYRYLFQELDKTGFDGWVGCEYIPRGDTVQGLAWVERCGVKLG